jgi:hypothetical protein
LSLFLSCAAQATYWDINGATAGAGGSAPAGTWDTTTPNWSDSEYGTNTTKAWSGDSEAGYAYIPQRSSNLVNWVEVETNTALASGPDAGLVQFAEVPPHNPAFYRARLP